MGSKLVDHLGTTGAPSRSLTSRSGKSSSLELKRGQFANQIANQLRGTERYQALQGTIEEAKLANQGAQLATGQHSPIELENRCTHSLSRANANEPSRFGSRIEKATTSRAEAHHAVLSGAPLCATL
jgi:hypothetical protein